jgi:hypothetical protein
MSVQALKDIEKKLAVIHVPYCMFAESKQVEGRFYNTRRVVTETNKERIGNRK